LTIFNVLKTTQEALKHPWLRGDTATDHNLLPEIRQYMAKARLRRGIEIVKLANRIEALKMQEDEYDESSEEQDVPADAKKAADQALGEGSAPKKSLSQITKGAIFREIVLAKVREMKDAETAAKVEQEAKEREEKRNKTI
jgi:calcium/calmodulin-dependent protein kinase I